MARVMLIEGDLLMRRRLRKIIDVNRGLHVVAEADSAANAAAAVAESAPDVLVMSSTTPGVTEIAPDHPTLHPLTGLPSVLLVSRSAQPDIRERARVLGLVAGESAVTDVAEAVRRAVAGESYTSSSLQPASDSNPPASTESDPYEFLTPRERQVLALLDDGKAPKEIATILGSSPATVRSHHVRILAKLRLRNDVALGRFLARHNPPHPPEA